METDGFMLSNAFYSEGPIRKDIHYGNEYEIIFVTAGAVDLQVGEKMYNAREDDLILLANLEQEGLRMHCESTCSRYCLFFHAPTTDACIHHPALLHLLKNHSAMFRHCLPAAPLREQLIGLFEKIMSCSPEEPYANELVAARLTEVLILVARLHPQPEYRSPGQERIFAVQRYLDLHFKESLRIEDVCRQHFVSTHYLSHQFREMTGYSPKQYLTLLRLRHAAGLLHETDLPVGEIAFASGFSDINNFCKQFKGLYGCTPTELRARV